MSFEVVAAVMIEVELVEVAGVEDSEVEPGFAGAASEFVEVFAEAGLGGFEFGRKAANNRATKQYKGDNIDPATLRANQNLNCQTNQPTNQPTDIHQINHQHMPHTSIQSKMLSFFHPFFFKSFSKSPRR